MTPEILRLILAAYFPVINVAAFAVCAFDKLRAKRGGRRIRENRFIALAIVGGGAGTLSGFYLLRHKTRHKRLLFAVWLMTIVSYALILWAALG